jgi:hypothetical protein
MRAFLPLRPIGPERVRVRWGTLQRQPDRPQYAFDVFKHLAIPESDDAIAAIRQHGAAKCVRVLLSTVLTAVKLDSELARWTGNIDNPLDNRMLAAKFPLRKILPQSEPKTPLDIGGVAAKPAREQSPRAQDRRCGLTHLTPTLSALKGGEGERVG